MRKLFCLVLGMLACEVMAQNVVQNGSFEAYGSTMTDWNSTFGYGWEGAAGSVPADGEAYLFVSGNIYQDLSTIPGKVYQLRYAVAGAPAYQGLTVLQTFWAGSQIASTTFDTTGHDNNNLGWIYVTNEVLATASITRLWFANPAFGTAVIPYLDAVSAIPVDATLPTTCLSPPSGLVGWWAGEGNANDSGGTNRGLLLNGTPFSNAVVGRGFSFNGVNQCVQVPYSPGLAASNYSVEAWIEPLGPVSDPSGRAVIFGQNGGRCQLLVSNGTQGLSVVFQFASDSAGSYQIASTNEIPFGQFTHLAGTWDGVALRLYLNGSLNVQGVPGLSPADPGCAFYIGGWYNPAPGSCNANGQFFNGIIDEVSLYQRALSDFEIQSLHDAAGLGKCRVPVPPVLMIQPSDETIYASGSVIFTAAATGDAPLGYQWSFNGTDLLLKTSASLVISNVQPASAGAYSVRVSNAAGTAFSSNAVLTVLPPPACVPAPEGMVAWWRAENDLLDGWDSNNGAFSPVPIPRMITLGPGYVAGKVGLALDLGSNGVFVADAPSLRLTNGLTIEGWVYPDAVVAITPRTILSKFDPPTLAVRTNSSYYFGLTNNQLYFAVSATGSGRTYTGLVYPGAVPSNQWSFVAATYDGAALRLYLNGAEVAHTNFSGNIFTGSSDVGLGAIANYPYCSGWPWFGCLDEISLYNRALSDAEIAAIFNADLTGKCLAQPLITAQPQSRAIPQGEDVLFAASVVGSKPLKYQWRFNGQNLPGATSSRLVLESLGASQVGNYSAFVTNALGQTTSSDALLSLLPPPSCDPAPSGLVSWWSADDSGIDAISTNNAKATSYFLGPAPYRAGKIGTAFSLTVTNDWIASDSTFTVSNSPALGFIGNADFSIEGWVKAYSAFPFSFPFELPVNTNQVIVAKCPPFMNGMPGPGFALCIYRERLACWISAVTGRLTNSGFFVSSGPKLRDNMFHHIAFTLGRASSHRGNLFVDGQAVLSFDTSALVGTLSNTAPLAFGSTLGGPDDSLNGLLDEVDLYNRTVSSAEVLALYQASAAGKCASPPGISLQPTNLLCNVGDTARFNVAATGFRPMYYQWFKDGVAIPNAISNSLTLTNVTLASAATYSVLVTNRAGALASSGAALSVNQLPTATNFIAATAQNVPLSIPVSSLLSFCSDLDGDPLSVNSVASTSAQGGSVGLNAGQVTYAPVTGFLGSDNFTFTITDSRGGNASALVLVRVCSHGELSPTLLMPAALSGGYGLHFTGVPGAIYHLERAETLSGPWTILTALTADASGNATCLDTNPPPTTAFYRVSYP